jgi:XRE family transcriptional regulator, regulator of sulfur utilization
MREPGATHMNDTTNTKHKRCHEASADFPATVATSVAVCFLNTCPLDFISLFRRNAHMITRRDFTVAAISISIAVAGMALAQSAGKPVMHSCVFNWADLKARPTKVGEVRAVFDAPTPTLAEFECHITTLNPGEAPHPPHRHADEELMVIKEGTLAALQDDKTNIVTTGGIIFEASNELHGLRNAGTNQATYYVFKFTPHDLVK